MNFSNTPSLVEPLQQWELKKTLNTNAHCSQYLNIKSISSAYLCQNIIDTQFVLYSFIRWISTDLLGSKLYFHTSHLASFIFKYCYSIVSLLFVTCSTFCAFLWWFNCMIVGGVSCMIIYWERQMKSISVVMRKFQNLSILCIAPIVPLTFLVFLNNMLGFPLGWKNRQPPAMSNNRLVRILNVEIEIKTYLTNFSLFLHK